MTADQLRAIPGRELLGEGGESLSPFIDFKLVPKSPAQAFNEGDAIHIPVIIGHNDDEGKNLMMAIQNSPQNLLGEFSAKVRAFYAKESPAEELQARMAFTDAKLGVNVRRIARELSRYAPTWRYVFTYLPQKDRLPDAGVGHADELQFVFDTFDVLHSNNADPKDLAEARLVNACWASFAKNGAPTDCGGAWPSYAEGHDPVMKFGDQSIVLEDWHKPALDLLDSENKQRRVRGLCRPS